ncbi:MAG: hypothetical protein KTR20_14550 [Cellvibrionaceae bacterium]|nr:hypothetical protein [Cellvibrionaceae bacterium]
MMRLFLWFCLFLVIGASGYHLITQGSGYVLIVWDKTSIEMSLWFALFILLASGLCLWLLLWVWRGGLRSLKVMTHSIGKRGSEKAQAITAQGLIDYIEEDWQSARKHLTRAATKVKAPLINYLAAARSAYELGDEQAALALLHKAENSSEHGGLAVSLTQARMQLSNRQYEQALASLERASHHKPEHPVLLNLRQQAYTALQDWASLKTLLPLLNKHHIGSSDDRHRLEITLHRALLQQQIDQKNTPSKAQALADLEAIWRQVPAHLQQQQTLLSLYASQLMALDKHEQAEKLLAAGLNQHWHGQWIDLYGLLLCNNSKHTLKQAESWLKKHSNSPGLLLALGRLCLRQQQWGRAIDFFKESLQRQERTETYAELARVLAHIGENKSSQAYYRQGLLSSTTLLAHNIK